MPGVFSTYAILLDDQQTLCAPGCYCAYRTGDRAFLRKFAGRRHDSTASPFPMDQFELEYGEPIEMLDKFNNPAPGQISRLVYRASLVSARLVLE